MNWIKVWWHCLLRTFSSYDHRHCTLHTTKTNLWAHWCRCGYKP